MFLVSVIAVVLVFVLTVLIGGGTSFTNFLDLPSVLMFFITVIPVLIGSGLIKDFGRSFKIGLSKTKDYSLVHLKNAVCAIKLVIKTLLATAGLVTVIAFMQIGNNISNLNLIGPNLAVALLSFCYTFFFVLILLPLKSRIEKMINEKLSFNDDEK